jgi:ubiquinone/menaquinone biosynthesis C-methylase UbiE
MTQASEKTGYVLAASGRETHEIARLELLQQIFDPVTERRLDLVEPGWRCLEVGAGRGSVAQILSERVGSRGEVIAADIDIGPLAHLDLPNGRVVRFNILTDPLDAIGGAGSFDLIHCRFLLQHLSERQDEGIARMVQLLKPGGWLVTEDTDTDNMAAADRAHPLTAAYNQAIADGVAMLHQTKAIDPVSPRRTVGTAP